MSAEALSTLERVAVAFDGRAALRDVSLSVRANEAWAVLGPNGAGKTTLARVVAGVLAPSEGRVAIGALRPPLEPEALAKLVAWVPQTTAEGLQFTALEVALLGRAAHAGRWGLTSAADEALARQALETFEVLHLAERPIASLSGGERRRVFLARAMAQQTPLVVLDEPTAFLDVKHQVTTLALARGWVSPTRAVVAVLHDVTLAHRFATHVALLAEGRLVAAGPTPEVLTSARLSEVFGTPMEPVPPYGFLPRWPT